MVALVLLGVSQGRTQNAVPIHSGITPGERVHVNLHSGVSLSGQVVEVTGSAVTLSSADAPMELLKTHSSPLRVSDQKMVFWLTDGTRMVGNVVEMSEEAVFIQRHDVPVNVARDRIAAVAMRGRKDNEAQVTLRWQTEIKDIRTGLQRLVSPGSRVRVQTSDISSWDPADRPSDPLVGVVVSMDDDHITLQTPKKTARQIARFGAAETVTIPLADVRRMEVSKGRKWSGMRAMQGAGLGLIGGVYLGAIAGKVAAAGEPEGELAYIVTLPVGAAIGLLGGFIFGAVPVEQWQRAPLSQSRLQIGVAPCPRGGTGVTLAYRF
jgi:hypothetical protein